MSADGLKDAFSKARLRGSKRTQLDELINLGKWKDAAKLKSELDGQLPTGQVVRFDLARSRN